MEISLKAWDWVAHGLGSATPKCPNSWLTRKEGRTKYNMYKRLLRINSFLCQKMSTKNLFHAASLFVVNYHIPFLLKHTKRTYISLFDDFSIYFFPFLTSFFPLILDKSENGTVTKLLHWRLEEQKSFIQTIKEIKTNCMSCCTQLNFEFFLFFLTNIKQVK